MIYTAEAKLKGSSKSKIQFKSIIISVDWIKAISKFHDHDTFIEFEYHNQQIQKIANDIDNKILKKLLTEKK